MIKKKKLLAPSSPPFAHPPQKFGWVGEFNIRASGDMLLGKTDKTGGRGDMSVAS